MSGILTSYQHISAQTYDTTIMLISHFKADGDGGQEASPSSNTVTRLACMDEVPNSPSGPATWFMPGAGVDLNSGSFITSETSGVKLRHRKAMTVKNLAAYFFNSGDPDTVTVHSRKNGANGNLTCSIGSSNALGQDTSNSDSIEDDK